MLYAWEADGSADFLSNKSEHLSHVPSDAAVDAIVELLMLEDF